MPKRLILLRHAKSDWSDAALRDFDRPLNKRGRDNAPRMGRLLHAKGLCPDLIISSDAKRALTTARLAAAELDYPVESILLSHALYLAPPETLLEVLVEYGGDAEQVMLVAHNPGMTDLANRASDARIDNLPTCGVFLIDVDTDWADLKQKPGRFAGFFSPKQDLD